MRKTFFFILPLLALVCAVGVLLRPAVLPADATHVTVRQEPDVTLAAPRAEEPMPEAARTEAVKVMASVIQGDSNIVVE